jgi:hypothetical protein
MEPVIIGAGGPSDPARIPLSTKKGNPIPNFRKPNRRPESLREAKRIWTERFPNIRNRSLDATYNCVGLVFAFRRVWVEDDHLPWLLVEEDYQVVDRPEVGDLVVYSDESKIMRHIGIVVNVTPNICNAEWEVTVLSQCGQDGEYIHMLRDVPLGFGNNIRFYSERKML